MKDRHHAVARGHVKEAALFRVVFNPSIRIAAAVALAVGSFVALRQRYHGDCVVPDYDLFLFLLLPVLFFVAFAWLTAELMYVLAAMTAIRRSAARLLSIPAALVAYALVAYITWLSSPLPSDQPDNEALRAWMSAFWGVGLLFKSGNFSNVSCGY